MSRRTQAQWRALIEQQQASGLSAAEFCRQQGVNAKYFSLRKKRLRAALSEFVQVMPGVSVSPKPAPSGIKLRVIEVELPLREGSQSDTLHLLLDRLLR